ncbi:MAG: pyridoxal phosphate-dependent aminotransferase [Thermoanaerobaculia bacterium]|nr:pyridoxal phosphate-dependent aminotransferase [Thermoanaerobaculia bacterium]
MRQAKRFTSIEMSLIRQMNAMAKPSTINLGIGEPNVEPDVELLSMARAAATGDWHYSPNAGNLSLRELVSARHGGSHDPNREICVTAGTMEALYAIAQAFVDPGDEVLVPDPGFLAYPAIATLAGATPVPYPLLPGSWDVDLDTLRRLVTPRTKMIVVNTPSNPTGAILCEKTLRAIAALADEHDILVVADEVYSEIFYETRPPSMLGMGRNVVVVDGMSKSHVMTGLRLGWILARPELMTTIYKSHQYIATCASVFSQQLAERILASSEWNAGWLVRMRAQFAAQRDALLDALRDDLGLTLPPPAAAFYAFFAIPSPDSLALATKAAAEADVLVIPGIAFGERGEGHLRVSYASDIATLREGVRRLSPIVRGA